MVAPMTAAADPHSWAATHFGKVEMSDIRRSARVLKIAQAMAAHPGKSIPQMMSDTYQVKATYKLLQHPEATPDTLQANHRKIVSGKLQTRGTYLLIEDTSEMIWSGRAVRHGLGPVGAGTPGLQGFLLHSVLAATWITDSGTEKEPCQVVDVGERRPAVEIIGLYDQQYHVRTRRPAGESKNKTHACKKRERESQVWEGSIQRSGLLPVTEEVRLIRVADRGADIYEYLKACQLYGYEFVVRASTDRVVIDPGTGERSGTLFEKVSAAPLMGSYQLKLRSRPGHMARTAEVNISAVEVEIRAPQRPGHGAGWDMPIRCTAVRVWEEQAPAGVDKLEWILLCDGKVENFARARECVQQYTSRWIVEEFHKALKTGMGAERLQIECAAGLFAAIAIMSVVALRLIGIREISREKPEAPATEAGLSRMELTILEQQRGEEIKTVKEVALAIGRLGGHLNRKGDGMPGWQTLWRGMTRLRDLVEGARMVLADEFGGARSKTLFSTG
jgi:hypothetical protein